MFVNELKKRGFNRRDAKGAEILLSSFLCALRVSAVSLPFLSGMGGELRHNSLNVRVLCHKTSSSAAFEFVGNDKP